jgi:carbon storage regulator CsrA
MLVLARKRGEIIDLPELGVSFTIIEFKSAGVVSVGIEAPAHIRVHRREVLEKIEAEKRQKIHKAPPASTGHAQAVQIWAKPRRVTGKSQSAGEQGTQQEGQQS